MNKRLRSTRARVLSVSLLVVLLAATVISTFGLHDLVNDQNAQLLHERTSEGGLVLTSALTSVEPSLEVLGATYAADPGGPVAGELVHGFASAAGDVTAIVTDQKDQLEVRVAGGSGIAAGKPLTGARATLVRRAVSAKKLVTDIIRPAHSRQALLAFAVALPGGVVVYQEAKLDPAQLTKSTGNSPFSELEGAVYVGPSADPSRLLFSTAKQLPLRGRVDSQVLHIGADRWLLVASARDSLVGTFAETAPWIVFALGLLISVIAFAAASVLLRRRAWALALVEERTATLRHTLAELETARASAEAANAAKSEFLSRMSHELRTPLNAVLGFAQVLDLGELTEFQQESVTQITKGGQHLLELINDILDISRIETGNLTLSPEPVLVSDVVGDVLDLIAPLAARRDIRCSVGAGDANGSYVFADRQRLRQILLNLLSNAVKYNYEGGTVTVSCEQRGELARIKVADSGPGIPAARLDMLFEPFERLGAEQTNVEGAGIGLALSRRLAEAMNGILDVDSTEGNGSTFWIELRLTEGPVEHHQRTTGGGAFAPADAGAADASTTPRHTVLYIEDNLANVKLIQHIFDYRRDIQLITTMQGRLGIELAQQHRPELILLDLHLPDMGGEAVLAELRANPDTAASPVIVLTADATERQHAKLLAAGATAYITKPINVQELLEVVDTNLSAPEPTSRVDGLVDGTDATLTRRS